MRKRAIGIMTGLLAVILLVPALAQDEPKQQRSEERYEQIDQARARIEIMEIDLAVEKQQLVQAMQFLKSVELPVRGSTEPELTNEQKKRNEEFVDRVQGSGLKPQRPRPPSDGSGRSRGSSTRFSGRSRTEVAFGD
jgi:hypothetical protein